METSNGTTIRLEINPNQKDPLSVEQVIGFLQKLNPKSELLILHVEEGSLLAAPLTEIFVSNNSETPEFISIYARDLINKKYYDDREQC